jgi:hypothetical protein
VLTAVIGIEAFTGIPPFSAPVLYTGLSAVALAVLVAAVVFALFSALRAKESPDYFRASNP